jgi:hypothetical protein
MPIIPPPAENGMPGMAYRKILEAGVIRPIFSTLSSVNHTEPSGPAAIAFGPLLAVGIGYSVIVGLTHHVIGVVQMRLAESMA